MPAALLDGVFEPLHPRVELGQLLLDGRPVERLGFPALAESRSAYAASLRAESRP